VSPRISTSESRITSHAPAPTASRFSMLAGSWTLSITSPALVVTLRARRAVCTAAIASASTITPVTSTPISTAIVADAERRLRNGTRPSRRIRGSKR
jgi:hypothetical protein